MRLCCRTVSALLLLSSSSQHRPKTRRKPLSSRFKAALFCLFVCLFWHAHWVLISCVGMMTSLEQRWLIINDPSEKSKVSLQFSLPPTSQAVYENSSLTGISLFPFDYHFTSASCFLACKILDLHIQKWQPFIANGIEGHSLPGLRKGVMSRDTKVSFLELVPPRILWVFLLYN